MADNQTPGEDRKAEIKAAMDGLAKLREAGERAMASLTELQLVMMMFADDGPDGLANWDASMDNLYPGFGDGGVR